jgi:tetratricopeptide (TPR) repeat protein
LARSTGVLALSAVAQGSVRPAECGSLGLSAPARTVWDESRDPERALYCDLLARGFAELRFAPRGALASADRAERLSPDRAAPALLRARALSALLDFPGAVAAFETAAQRDPKSLDEPGALRELGFALQKVGRFEDALTVYLTLAPRASLLAGTELHRRALLEGGEIALALGPRRLGDAVRLLSAAREIGGRDAREEIDAALALALERKGESEEAQAVLSEIGGASGDRMPSEQLVPIALGAEPDLRATPEDARRERPAHDPVARQGLAIRAMLEERLGRSRAALISWQAYLDESASDEPFRAQAESHIAALGKKGPAKAPIRIKTRAGGGPL